MKRTNVPLSCSSSQEAGPVLRGRAFELEQEWPVDLLDIDSAVLDGLERVGELEQFAGGDFRVGEGTGRDKFHWG